MRQHAIDIWNAGVEAMRPRPLVARAFEHLPDADRTALARAERILVVGCGKAGAEMAAGVEEALADRLGAIRGLVNVPAGSDTSTARIRLHEARPAGANFPTAAGVVGAEEMLALLAEAGPDDVAICLISGGGSALLPAPVNGVTLEAKLEVTKLLHSSGATIGEMNCVRKHLSRVKGGRLAEAFRGKLLLSFIISDVVGDPLDVIASGPTSPDPTTFAEAIAILNGRDIWDRVPVEVRSHLEAGERGDVPETPKAMAANVRNIVIGSNAIALAASRRKAEELGYRVIDLGSNIEGETAVAARSMAEVVRSVEGRPACILSGGETTVTLGDHPGKGGRNQEFVLAMLVELGAEGMKNVVLLSGGTDGEDGPTDAAGAIADAGTPARGGDAADHLRRHDAYPYFDRTGDLLRPGLTGTNVMDLRVLLVQRNLQRRYLAEERL